ncbi:ATP-dependent Clp protease ATP-binding subunit [Bordetella pertussis]|nr:ATP-dependent Clp protease ATP-binding subunit [Bordetella pertussis]CPM21361.1 ATP-dependent Clp protease ATP-binding subunit [Bordetella pertussis]
MYDLPSQGNVSRVVLEANAVEGVGKPLLIYADESEAASGEKAGRGEVRDAAA